MTRKITVGAVAIGGGARVSVQSMCSADTRDAEAVLSQIERLAEAGCEIVRVAVPDMDAAAALGEITRRSPLPVVADIHFDYRLALESAARGVAKIRINPGNIGSRDRVREVARACSARGIPIRIGVNGGSLDRDLLARRGLLGAMTESALGQLHMLEDMGFTDVCLSLKASSVRDTIAAYREISRLTDCPLHLGVTETGTAYHGIIKSAMGIGALLCDGIGDTIRVSLTADPVEEVLAGKAILRVAGLRREGAEIISCPTCGRCRIDVQKLAAEVEKALSHVKKHITVAVMGCAVNGPGEAREADCGCAGGEGSGLLFSGGEIVKKVAEEELLPSLLALVYKKLEDI